MSSASAKRSRTQEWEELRLGHDSLKAEILGLVHQRHPNHRWSSWQLKKLPGPLPSTLSRRNLGLLKQQQYWVTEKSDGIRKMMLIPRVAQSFATGECLLIDRAWSAHVVREPRFSELLCRNGPTLMDGELIELENEQRQKCFLAYDIIVLDGEFVGNRTLEERLRLIEGRVIRRLKNSDHAEELERVLPIRLKFFVPVFEILRITSKIRKTSSGSYEFYDMGRQIRNKNDGLIFTANNDSYIPSRPDSLLKWKWLDKISVDFKLKSPYFNHADELIFYAGYAAPVGDIKVRSQPVDSNVREWIEREFIARGIDSVVVECTYDKQNSSWRIEHIRSDKTDANYITTVFSTLETIIDNIKIEEVTHICSRGWKGPVEPIVQSNAVPDKIS